MCKPINWLEFENGKVLYLTDEEIFHTERGKALREYCQNKDDLVGHGAIRWYYEVNGGEEKEVNDFIDPASFPAPILADFVSGKMKKMILDLTPCIVILSKPAWEQYMAVKQAAWEQYEAVKQPAWEQYLAVKQPAWEQYLAVEQAAFWNLLMNPENRVKLWQEA